MKKEERLGKALGIGPTKGENMEINNQKNSSTLRERVVKEKETGKRPESIPGSN